MPDFRSYYEYAPKTAGEQIALSPEESNHLVAANRARAGDPVSVFDGKGTESDARLIDANKRKAVLEIVAIRQIPPAPYQMALAQALPKGKLMESIIRKATELGAQQIFPVATSRCEVKIDPNKKEAKNAKWTAASLEGAKQSGNPHLVSIEPLCTLKQLIERAAEFDLKLIASLEDRAVSLKKHLAHFHQKNPQRPPLSAICLIGPEGDFTAEEYEAAIEGGFLPTTLGPHVMRSETAAAHALSIIHYELSES